MSLYRLEKNSQSLSAMKKMIAQTKRFLPVLVEKVSLVNDPQKISRQELLAVSDSISLYYAPKIAETSKKLTLLSIDPQHLYCYWNLLEEQPATLSQSLMKKEWVLNVFAEKKQGAKIHTKSVVEVEISELQASANIKLPAVESGVTYKAIITKEMPNKGFFSLLQSNKVSVFQDHDLSDSFVSVNETLTNEYTIDRLMPTVTETLMGLASLTQPPVSVVNFSGQNNLQSA